MGTRLTKDHEADRVGIVLPPSNTRRWVASRKAQVVRAIETGILTEAEAYRRYALTPEELADWRRKMADHGTRGLFATRIRYRNRDRAGL